MSPDALYAQVARELRRQIMSGQLKPGDVVPSEGELSDQHRVSRQTVRDAFKLLISEGLITAGQGRRRRVRSNKPMVFRIQEELEPRPTNPEMDQFLQRFSVEGRTPSQAIDVAVTSPPDLVRERLQLEDDALSVVRRRVRFLDGEASHLNDTYFPYEIVKDTEIMRPEDIAKGAMRVLRDHGYKQARNLDEIWVRMPTESETQRLGLPQGTPVAQHVRTTFTAEGQPIRCAVSIFPGDRNVMALELDVPETWK
ncbi:GntR family transcriptional regulator [Spirillospora sp. NPDC048911]|uniref:GntR family transcriptional regulator n=1 Tax=Spirillospora sp. NPDC048911 TaxID=3364527 RepID=UPI00371764C6